MLIMLLRASTNINLILIVLFGLAKGAYLIDFSNLYRTNSIGNVKREVDMLKCHPTKPFRCPGVKNLCISLAYLCDGQPDCEDGYDEDVRLCVSAKRPPVDETGHFLQTLLANHGPNYLEKLFGKKARDALIPLGGVQKVAVALSESQNIEDFGKTLHLMRSDVEHLRNVFVAVESGDLSVLRTMGFKENELGDLKFFFMKLLATGFLD